MNGFISMYIYMYIYELHSVIITKLDLYVGIISILKNYFQLSRYVMEHNSLVLSLLFAVCRVSHNVQTSRRLYCSFVNKHSL